MKLHTHRLQWSQVAPTAEATHRPSCKASACHPSSSLLCSLLCSIHSSKDSAALVHEKLLKAATACTLGGEQDNNLKTAQKATAHTQALLNTQAPRLHCSAQLLRGMQIQLFSFAWSHINLDRPNCPVNLVRPNCPVTRPAFSVGLSFSLLFLI